jgi:hypothetical protein
MFPVPKWQLLDQRPFIHSLRTLHPAREAHLPLLGSNSILHHFHLDEVCNYHKQTDVLISLQLNHAPKISPAAVSLLFWSELDPSSCPVREDYLQNILSFESFSLFIFQLFFFFFFFWHVFDQMRSHQQQTKYIWKLWRHDTCEKDKKIYIFRSSGLTGLSTGSLSFFLMKTVTLINLKKHTS